jgi:hypothetical protein
MFFQDGKLDPLTGKYTINNSNRSLLDGGSTNDASSRGGEGEEAFDEEDLDDGGISMSNGSKLSSEKKRSRM